MASDSVSCFLVLFVVSFLLVEGGTTTINNNLPRLDENGNIMDAHDGTIRQFTSGGPFYYHAMQYGACEEPINMGCDSTPDNCGFQLDHNISIYKSYNLSSGSWIYVGNAIEWTARPTGVVFRPHLVYNPNTKKYVLWWNYSGSGQYQYAIALADSPEGPFELAVPHVNLSRAAYSAGDFDIFVDDDGIGYIIYSANYEMSVEQLTDDYLSGSGIVSPIFSEYFVEAPTIFKRNGIYYALFDWCCCFCMQGSGAIVHVAAHPLGPWTTQDEIACRNGTLPGEMHEGVPTNTFLGGEPTPGQGCLRANSNATSVTKAQQNFVIQVNTTEGWMYIWTGDRWQQSPTGLKADDPQFWAPLVFNSDGSIQLMNWIDSFTFDVVL